MFIYHSALSASNTGLPKFQPEALPPGLTAGGKIVFQLTRRPVETCNLIASVKGIVGEYRHD